MNNSLAICMILMFFSFNSFSTVPHQFEAGQTIEASKINENFLAVSGGGSTGGSSSSEYKFIYQTSYETQVSYVDSNYLSKNLSVSAFYQDNPSFPQKALRADVIISPQPQESPTENTKETCLANGFVWRVTYSQGDGSESTHCTHRVYAGYFKGFR